ncbi:hypothetical protein [Flaviflagellibacter deserti]|uniref:Uncharacterized protein n=1 Tax=Flaviflagellibacter deserti TaxID=2267266 RepID=A0ABV9Z1E7_9HYPH
MVPMAVAKNWLEHDHWADEDPWNHPRPQSRARARAIRMDVPQNVLMMQAAAIALGLAFGTALWKLSHAVGMFG